MKSVLALVALERRGYISKEAVARVMQKRASVVIDRIATATSATFSKTAIAMPAGGALARFGSKVKGGVGGGWPEWMANVAKVMGVGAGLAAGNAAVGAVGHAAGKIGQKGKIKASRQQVMGLLEEKNPEVAKQQAEVFDLVARYAPTLAADPLVASGIVRGIVSGSGGGGRNVPRVDMQFAKNLAEAETRVNESRVNTRFGRMHDRAVGNLPSQFNFGGDR